MALKNGYKIYNLTNMTIIISNNHLICVKFFSSRIKVLHLVYYDEVQFLQAIYNRNLLSWNGFNRMYKG